LGQAQGQVTQQVSSISGQLGTTVTQANTAGSGMVSQVATSLGGQIGQIESGFEQGLEQYSGGLDEQVTSAEEKAREPRESLSGRVDQGQHKAEERARHSLLDDPLGWIGDQLSDLWDMLSDPGFWVGLLVGVALAFVVVAAVAAAPFTGGASIALLIGGMALAGGLAAVAGTIVSNITDHSVSNLFSGNLDWSRWSDNLGSSFLIGALFGAGLVVAELLGAGLIALSITAGVFTVITNHFTGQPLDKNLLANMLFVGVISKLFRLARRRAPVGEEPPVRPPVEEPPGPKPKPPNFLVEAEAAAKPLVQPQTAKALKRFDMSNDPAANDTVAKTWKDTFTDEFVRQRQDNKDIKTARKAAQKLADAEATKVAISRAIEAARQRAKTDLQNGDAFKQDANTEAVRNEYNQGTRGGNAKSLSPRFAGRTIGEIIDILDRDVTSGRCTKSTSNLLMPNGQPPKPQIGYQYPDGTLVRVKPKGDAYSNNPMYSVEVTNSSSGPVTGQGDIAFKVGIDGKAVPKGRNDVNNPYNKGTNAEQHNAYLEEVIKAGHITAKANPPPIIPPPQRNDRDNP
jgi:hypothetical protein